MSNANNSIDLVPNTKVHYKTVVYQIIVSTVLLKCPASPITLIVYSYQLSERGVEMKKSTKT